jgi:hypothetical protein
MVQIQFPDGAVRSYEKGITALGIAKSISEGLAKKVLAASIDGEVWDATRPINQDAALKLLTWDDADGKNTFWHSSAHLLAEAVEMQFPGAKFWVGPALEKGFYYDIDLGGKTIKEEDVVVLEQKMNELAKKANDYIRKEMSKAEAVAYFTEKGDEYKLDLLSGLEDGTITFYTQGGFTDLCRGPHIPNTSVIKAIKITYIAGAFGTGLGTFLYAQGYAPTTIVGTPAVPTNPGGFTFWGNNQPDFNASFFNSFNILKNLELSVLVDWKQGGDNINLSAFLADGGGTTKGWFDDANGDGIPNGRQRDPAPYNNAGRWVMDASFVKIREVGLYYTFPKTTLAKIFNGAFKGIKLGASANNLFLFTDYFGYDPETSTFGAQSIANNVDIAPYPTPRRIFFHLNFDF